MGVQRPARQRHVVVVFGELDDGRRAVRRGHRPDPQLQQLEGTLHDNGYLGAVRSRRILHDTTACAEALAASYGSVIDSLAAVSGAAPRALWAVATDSVADRTLTAAHALGRVDDGERQMRELAAPATGRSPRGPSPTSHRYLNLRRDRGPAYPSQESTGAHTVGFGVIIFPVALSILARSQSPASMGRLGRPGEIAEPIAWLSSNAPSFSTGAVYDASGGHHLASHPGSKHCRAQSGQGTRSATCVCDAPAGTKDGVAFLYPRCILSWCKNAGLQDLPNVTHDDHP